MSHYLIFVIGVFVGTLIGVVVTGLLSLPRIAELEDTVDGLREYIRFHEEEG
jgi:hypothetical protein